MPLTRLKNIITSRTGRIIYVNPDDFDASDAVDNRGNSPLSPFKSLQRALLEVARFSYRGGRGNDEFDAFTILLHPSEYIIDNRPGRAEDVLNTEVPVLSDSSNFDILDPSNDLYKYNSTDGGVIVPRGCSIVGMDLRRTKIIPKFVPYPYANTDAGITEQDPTAIFRVTGGCYFWQFSFFDGHDIGVYYDAGISTTIQPQYSHHKLTCFEYADLSDLELYYKKISIAFTDIPDTTGTTSTDQLQPRIEENRIVGPISDTFQVSRITRSGKRATVAVVDSQGLPFNHGFSVGTVVNVSGAREGSAAVDSDLYNGSFVVTSSNADVFSYEMRAVPAADATNTGIQARVEIDTVDSASPYMFNLTLRSTWGINGMHADGSKATGFKSMVVAQFTGISLQKDDNVFVKWDGTSYVNAGQDAHLKGSSRYKKGMRTAHIRASNDAFIQAVSVFAVGFADHFLCESGGDMSITNSNSNFGNTAIRSIGFKADPFTKDSQGKIVGVIPPKNIDAVDELNLNYLSLDLEKTIENNGTSGTWSNGAGLSPSGTFVKLYLYGYTDAASPPPTKVQGYTVGARKDEDETPDKLFLNLVNYAGSSVTTSAKITPSYSTTVVEDNQNVTKLIVDNPPTSTGTINPIQWDATVNNWFIKTEATDNTLFTTLINNSNNYTNISGGALVDARTGVSFSGSSFIKRRPDLRTLRDRIYRLKYVIPNNVTIVPRDPISGYVLKPRATSVASGNAWTDNADNIYYVYEIEKIQQWEQNKTDGVYYLTVLLASVTPTDSEVDDRKLSQNVLDVYPVFDRDNPRSNPLEATSFADNVEIGVVRSTEGGSTYVTNRQRSITRESVGKLMLDIYGNSGLTNDLKMVASTLTDSEGDVANTTTNYAANGAGDVEARLIPLVSDQQKDVELRRPSTVRSGNHTFEYLGFGPGNYSTAFPSSQEETLTDNQVKYSQSIKEQAGVAFYSGLNSNGELFIGNSKIDPVTGAVTNEDVAQLNVVGEADASIQTFGEVVVEDRLTVTGGANNTLQSFFSGPVTFENTVSANDEILAKKLSYIWTSPGTGTDTQTRSTFLVKQATGLAAGSAPQPDFTATYDNANLLTFNDGDIAYNIDLEDTFDNRFGTLGWVRLNSQWIPFATVGSDVFKVREFGADQANTNKRVAVGDTDPDTSFAFKVGGSEYVTENLQVDGKHGMLRPYDANLDHAPAAVTDRGDASAITAANISQRYINRRFTVAAGTGGSQNFTISPNHTAESILVFVNGVRQVPHGNYTVTNDQVGITLPTTLDVETFVDILELPL